MTILDIDVKELIYIIPLSFVMLSLVTKSYKKDFTLDVFNMLMLIDAYLYVHNMKYEIFYISIFAVVILQLRAIYNKQEDKWVKR